jgi:8-oxo-dGTP pyrophosphatase MutT (NUDIX family)
MPGAGGVFLMKYHRNNKITIIVMLVKERYGAYKNQYSLPAGNYDNADGFYNGQPDLFKTLRRETSEEVGIQKVVNAIGARRDPYIYAGKTPIWLVFVPSGVSRKHFVPNNEILKLEFFKAKSMVDEAYRIKQQQGHFSHGTPYYVETIDGVKKPVSSYALSAVYKISEKLNS